MIELDNQTTLQINLSHLSNILDTLSSKNVELIITDNDTIQEINRDYRGKDSPTDVLSFPLEQNSPHIPLGTIIISESFVINMSKTYNHSIDDEVALLFIHGLLHLLGYDHEIDDGEMRDKEKSIIENCGLPNSLIIRVE